MVDLRRGGARAPFPGAEKWEKSNQLLDSTLLGFPIPFGLSFGLSGANVAAAVHPANQRFQQEIENHEHAISLHYFYYNLNRKHQTLKTIPAVAAGIANRALTVLDLVTMIEDEESKLGERLTNYLPSPKGPQ